MMTRVEDLDVDTLIDENTKLILTDDGNPKQYDNANGATWCPNCFLMQVVPPGGQISY